jgi:hypothetical protein
VRSEDAVMMTSLTSVRSHRRLSDTEKIDSMNLLLYMAPIATAALVPATLILEPNAIVTARGLATEHPCGPPQRLVECICCLLLQSPHALSHSRMSEQQSFR